MPHLRLYPREIYARVLPTFNHRSEQMKRAWIVGLIAVVLGGAPLAYAADAASDGAKTEATCSKGTCAKFLDGITLTDDQKSKIDEIEKSCDGSKDSCAKAKDSIRALLSEDQQKTFDANSAKCKKGHSCCEEKGAA
jgi:Spy/CpxP family protein refolding chaperone